jgi:hypothetical protein
LTFQPQTISMILESVMFSIPVTVEENGSMLAAAGWMLSR